MRAVNSALSSLASGPATCNSTYSSHESTSEHHADGIYEQRSDKSKQGNIRRRNLATLGKLWLLLRHRRHHWHYSMKQQHWQLIYLAAAASIHG